jgi:head-tail adaptor
MAKRWASPVGAMHERLVIQESDVEPITVTTLTRTSTTATATTAEAHAYTTGDYATVAGAVPAGYNGKVKITVTGLTTFTYPVSGLLATPATGTITVTYVSDAQGGKRIGWETLADAPDGIWAELVPIRSDERLQLAAIRPETAYRFRVRARADLNSSMRAIWTPTWPPNAPTQTLEITGVLPHEHGRAFTYLECREAP